MKIRYTALVGALLLIAVVPLFGQDVVNGFLDDFEPKFATLPPFEEATKTTAAPTVTVTINASDTLGKVSTYLYGNNANLWMSQMVTEPALMNHLNLLTPNIIRFPGGNITNVFFWNAAVNQPPADVPDSLFDSNGRKIPANFWWFGKNTASWTLSVDNYYEMLNQTYSTGIICVNYSYARYGTGPDPAATAAHYAAEWVRYDDGRTKFWEIGNEDFGPWQAGYKIDTKRNQDGQPEIITGTIYGKHFKAFADSMRKAAQEIGSTIYIGAQLIEDPVGNSWIPPARTWNKDFFTQAGNAADFSIVHNYFTNYGENSNAATILNSAATRTTNIMNYMKQTTSENQVLLKPIALTEWNIFAVGSKQSCSFINGIHSTIVLGELARNGYSMSSRWDLANGYDNGNDHGMFNKGDEPGAPVWNPRPAFFYMYYFQKSFGDHVVRSSVTGSNNVLAYSSKFKSGHAGIVVVNKGTTEHVVRLTTQDYKAGERFYVYSLTGGNDNGEFSQSVYVNDVPPTNATGGPIDGLADVPAWAYPVGDEIKFTSPGRSVQFVLVEPGQSVSVDETPEIVGSVPMSFTVYPNPATGLFKLDLQKGRFNKLEIFDVLGRKVYSKVIDPSQTVLPLQPNLTSGVYFVRLFTGREVKVKKLLIHK